MFDKPWYVYFSFVALGLAMIIFARAVSNKFPGKQPPIFEEIPFIGGIMGFVKNPIDLGKRGYSAVGEVRNRHVYKAFTVTYSLDNTSIIRTDVSMCCRCSQFLCCT